MEKANKQVGLSSSSSFAVDLFGPKDSPKSSTSSTTGFFSTIFGPPSSMGPAGDPPQKDFANCYGNLNHETNTDNKSEKRKGLKKEKNSSSSYENGRSVEPCYYNSSIYYGGQEVYSPTTPNTPPNNTKRDGGNVDQNESNSTCASRGNWWQGSLYY